MNSDGFARKEKTPSVNKQEGITTPLCCDSSGVRGEGFWGERGSLSSMCIHKPCLASEADTWSASVDSCGESAMLMLPEEDTVLSCWGESSKEMISAPWSVRALAVSRKFSLWLSIGVLNLYEGVGQEGCGGC